MEAAAKAAMAAERLAVRKAACRVMVMEAWKEASVVVLVMTAMVEVKEVGRMAERAAVDLAANRVVTKAEAMAVMMVVEAA